MSKTSHSFDLHKGNCLDVLKTLKPKSVDLILTDFPYGILNVRNEWDKMPDLDEVWNAFHRVARDNAAIITTAKQPFTSHLIMSNLSDFKYALIWEKSKATGYLDAKRRPMCAHEDIVVFYRKPPIYNPQMTDGKPYNKGTAVRDTEAYARQTKAVEVKNGNGQRYPRSVQYFRTAESEGKFHPTQKPVALFEWLIRTYSDPNALVIDPFMGSGTTGIACLNTGRRFIGIEKFDRFFKAAQERLQSHQSQQLELPQKMGLQNVR